MGARDADGLHVLGLEDTGHLQHPQEALASEIPLEQRVLTLEQPMRDVIEKTPSSPSQGVRTKDLTQSGT